MLSYQEFDMPDSSASFEERGGWVVNHLMIDLAPIQLIHAGAVVGNLGGESGLKAINEARPLVKGSRGGWSWAQWTGEGEGRRGQFERFCDENNFPYDSDQGAYEFLIWELNNTEKHSLEQLRKTTSLEAAVYTFCVLFERPSDPQGGLKSRIRFAQRALAGASELEVPESEEEITERLNQEELRRVSGGMETSLSSSSEIVLEPKEVIKLSEQVPPARTSPGVGVIMGTGFTAQFAAAIQYFADWPLKIPDDGKAMSLAGFFLTAGATVFHLWANKKSRKIFDQNLGGKL